MDTYEKEAVYEAAEIIKAFPELTLEYKLNAYFQDYFEVVYKGKVRFKTGNGYALKAFAQGLTIAVEIGNDENPICS
ncbi:hypothetical protein [Vibrio phage VCPH]|nr:hypothetical protein [Vibrio phage VCPH]